MTHETGMIESSGTQPNSQGETRAVKIQPGGSELQSTSHFFIDTQLIPVHVSDGQVVLRVNTRQISEQQAIEKANESIRRRSRG